MIQRLFSLTKHVLLDTKSRHLLKISKINVEPFSQELKDARRAEEYRGTLKRRVSEGDQRSMPGEGARENADLLIQEENRRFEEEHRDIQESEQPGQKKGNRKRRVHSITRKVSLSGSASIQHTFFGREYESVQSL